MKCLQSNQHLFDVVQNTVCVLFSLEIIPFPKSASTICDQNKFKKL